MARTASSPGAWQLSGEVHPPNPVDGLSQYDKARIGCHDEGSCRAWRSRRSRTGIKFIDPMNRTYGVELPKYQNTENPKYQKSKVPNTLMRPYIFVTGF
jgi:hypothetical protein